MAVEGYYVQNTIRTLEITIRDLEKRLEKIMLESPQAGEEVRQIIDYLKIKEKKIQDSLRLF